MWLAICWPDLLLLVPILLQQPTEAFILEFTISLASIRFSFLQSILCPNYCRILDDVFLPLKAPPKTLSSDLRLIADQ